MAGVNTQVGMNPAEVVEREVERGAAQWFSNFLEKPFVSRVKRRMLIRMVSFWRSMCDV
jgi:hypothetical protein